MPRQPAVPILGAPIKLTLRLQTPTKKISEVHWYGASTNITGAQVNTDATNLGNARAACVAFDCKLLGWDLSQENVYRDDWPDPGLPFAASGIAAPENEGNDCLPIFMSGTTQYRRTMYFSCIPDTVISDDKFTITDDTVFQNAIIRYMGMLTGANPYVSLGGSSFPANNKWGFLPRQADLPATPLVNIVAGSMTFASLQTTWGLTTSAAHMAVAGDVVQVSKVQGVSQLYPLNQLWTVSAAPTPTTLVLQGFPASVLPVIIPVSGGFVQKKVRDFQAYDGYAIGLPTTRNRGNSSGEAKGRKKVKYNIGFPG